MRVCSKLKPPCMVVPKWGVSRLNRLYGGDVIPTTYPNFFCHHSMTLYKLAVNELQSSSWSPCTCACVGGGNVVPCNGWQSSPYISRILSSDVKRPTSNVQRPPNVCRLVLGGGGGVRGATKSQKKQWGCDCRGDQKNRGALSKK